MTDIIDFNERKKQRDGDDSTFEFSVHVMRTEDGHYWARGDSLPDGMDLQGLARILRDIAWQADNIAGEEEDGDPLLAVACIYKSSRVSTVVNTDHMETDEQYEWLDERFDEAKGAVRP